MLFDPNDNSVPSSVMRDDLVDISEVTFDVQTSEKAFTPSWKNRYGYFAPVHVGQRVKVPINSIEGNVRRRFRGSDINTFGEVSALIFSHTPNESKVSLKLTDQWGVPIHVKMPMYDCGTKWFAEKED